MTQKSLGEELRNSPDYKSRKRRAQYATIARDLVRDSANVTRGQKILLWYEEPALPLMKLVHKECEKLDTTLFYYKRDLEKDARDVAHLDKKGIDAYFKEQYDLIRETDTSIIVRAPENPEALEILSKEKRRMYTDAYSRANEPRISGERGWTLFYYPTRYEARKEGLGYEKYVDLVMTACDQPWERIYECQKKLVRLLDGAETLRLVANPDDPDKTKRTDVTMSIKGMTFVNSTIDQNYPGSEVFSAPVLKSVKGHIFASGQYMYSGHLMEDLAFDIKDGKIVEASAKKHDTGLQEILSAGHGARYFGEVALGTNPGLSRRFFNALLNEKVGGSFHMALGHCYTFTQYDGIPVNVNNGNTSDKTPNHWDITISMRPEAGGGAVYVDGEMIQKNGRFLDPDLSILNHTKP